MARVRPGDPLLAVAYLRVSTEEQHLGPEAQRMAITRWAELGKVTVVSWRTDAGVSGAADVADRPSLGAALDDLVAHKAGVLVVARRDRLARDVVIAATIERTALRCGARVLSADGPADQFMRTILDGAAAYERALIRARTRAALKARRAQNKRAGNVPWGYDADAEGSLRDNPREREVVERVISLRASGSSLRGIVKALADDDARSRTGNSLRLTQVVRILQAQKKTG
jgi:DNA invertase Pin-like site-specific DNA recombinase